MKKIVTTLGIGCLLMAQSGSQVFAEENESPTVTKSAIRQEVKNQIQAINEERKEEKQEEKDTRKQEKPLTILERLLRIRAMVNGTITAKTVTTLTIKGTDNASYLINITDKTILRRKFWGKATLAEMQVGDSVNVIGKWADTNKTSINAILIRDMSIRKRAGVFFGDVTSITGTGAWVMNTIRGVETVTATQTTKFVNRKEEVIGKGDILVGHRIRVKGLWDAEAHTITDVTQVKDFTLPPQTGESVNTSNVTPTVKPTVTVTPTATRTPTPTLTPTPTQNP